MSPDVNYRLDFKQAGWRFYANVSDVKRCLIGEIDRVPAVVYGHDALSPDVEEIEVPSLLVVDGVVYEVRSIVSELTAFVSDLPMLRRLKLSETVTKIGGLLPKSAVKCGSAVRLFCNLPRLRHVELPGELEHVGGLNVDVLCDCPELLSVTIPVTLRDIACRFLSRCGEVDLLVADLDRFIDISYHDEGRDTYCLPSEEKFEASVADWLDTQHPGLTVCNHDGGGWPELRFPSVPRSGGDNSGYFTPEFFRSAYMFKHAVTCNRVLSRWIMPDDTVKIFMGSDGYGAPAVMELGRFVNCRELLFQPEVNYGFLTDWPVRSLKRIVLTAAINFENAVMDREMHHAEGLAEILYRPEISADKLDMGGDVMQIMVGGEVAREITYSCFVDSGTFAGQLSLKRVELPEGIDLICEYAFSGCSALSELVLPSTIKTIMTKAFIGCDSLKHVVIPNKDCVVDDDAFPADTVVTQGA